jgi:hypothetical protein
VATATIHKTVYPFYCKQQGTPVGFEITRAEKRHENPDDYIRAEGRIALRFFNAGQNKETHLRMVLETWEASAIFQDINRILQSSEPLKLKLVIHKFEREGREIITTLSAEKWARNGKGGYALMMQRGDVSHNVSLNGRQFWFAADALRELSHSQSYQDVPASNGAENER